MRKPRLVQSLVDHGTRCWMPAPGNTILDWFEDMISKQGVLGVEYIGQREDFEVFTIHGVRDWSLTVGVKELT